MVDTASTDRPRPLALPASTSPALSPAWTRTRSRPVPTRSTSRCAPRPPGRPGSSATRTRARSPAGHRTPRRRGCTSVLAGEPLGRLGPFTGLGSVNHQRVLMLLIADQMNLDPPYRRRCSPASRPPRSNATSRTGGSRRWPAAACRLPSGRTPVPPHAQAAGCGTWSPGLRVISSTMCWPGMPTLSLLVVPRAARETRRAPDVRQRRSPSVRTWPRPRRLVGQGVMPVAGEAALPVKSWRPVARGWPESSAGRSGTS